MPVSSRFCRNSPSISPTVGKFCTPAKPTARIRSRNSSKLQNGSVPFTPAITGVEVTTGSTSRAISMTMSLALPKASMPASEPRPAMR